MFEDVTEEHQVGSWDDHDCDEKLNYLCKGPVSSANPEPPTSKCSILGFENYAPYRDNCYWFSNKAKSWNDAEADCNSQGAHLMSILDDSEQAFVFAHMNAEKIWVGLSDVKVRVKIFVEYQFWNCLSFYSQESMLFFGVMVIK